VDGYNWPEGNNEERKVGLETRKCKDSAGVFIGSKGGRKSFVEIRERHYKKQWWLHLAKRETERERILSYKVFLKGHSMAGGVAQVIACLPSKHEALSSNHNTTK
jgi:hypothetical protein